MHGIEACPIVTTKVSGYFYDHPATQYVDIYVVNLENMPPKETRGRMWKESKSVETILSENKTVLEKVC